MRAMRADRAARTSASGNGEAKKPPSAFVSLRGGMHELVDAVASHLGETEVRTGASMRAVEAIQGEGTRPRYRVVLDHGDALEADAVILTAPLYASSAAVRGLDASLADALGAFTYASTATVFMAFRREAIAHALDAVGFIVPRSSRREILAATWVSSKWESRAPEGQVLIRVFFGGAGREKVLAKDDVELGALALSELRTIMSIDGSPLFTRIFRFTRASPQPTVGHLGRLRVAKERLARWPGLAVATNGFDGIGIPDCIRQAEAAVAAIAPILSTT
jgi:oxygen-dependent protoporphyrinogen oxidase